MPFSVFSVGSQKAALKKLAEMTQRAMLDPAIVKAAKQITADCDARDDKCELSAIFYAVKEGTDYVPGLENGVRYVADPLDADYFTAPAQLLKQCRDGACSGDCDDQASLLCALAGALGFVVGLRAYGSDPRSKEYEHVYAVAKLPKTAEFDPNGPEMALDTTVSSAKPGWEPPGGRVLTAWIY